MSSTPLPSIFPPPSASVSNPPPTQTATSTSPPLQPTTHRSPSPIILPTAAVLQEAPIPPTPLLVAHEAAHPPGIQRPAVELVSVVVPPEAAQEAAQHPVVAAAAFQEAAVVPRTSPLHSEATVLKEISAARISTTAEAVLSTRAPITRTTFAIATNIPTVQRDKTPFQTLEMVQHLPTPVRKTDAHSPISKSSDSKFPKSLGPGANTRPTSNRNLWSLTLLERIPPRLPLTILPSLLPMKNLKQPLILIKVPLLPPECEFTFILPSRPMTPVPFPTPPIIMETLQLQTSGRESARSLRMMMEILSKVVRPHRHLLRWILMVLAMPTMLLL